MSRQSADAEAEAREGVRRSRSALSPHTEVELVTGDRRLRAALLDVSLSGLRVLRPQGLDTAVGDTAELVFPLDDHAPLLLRARLARASDAELAYHFDGSATVEQEDALRGLIRRRGQLRDGEAASD